MIQRAFLKRYFLSFFIFITAMFIAQSGYPDTTYMIQKGDNPTTIAKKYHVKTKDILLINDLDPRRLIPGTEIIIPSIKENPLDTDNLVKEPDKPPTSYIQHKEDVPDDTITHSVKKGDTLSHLSRKYSISIHALQEINNLKSTKIIVGQMLLVKQKGQRTYLVNKGDSLWGIARRFHYDVDELFDINKLETDVIKPGQTILLHNQEEPENFINREATSMKHIEDGINDVSASDEYTLRKKLILLAKQFLDIPYRFGGKSFLGIDCSAFVQEVFSLIGIDLPRSVREQFSHGYPIDKDQLSIGDLVFFRTYASFPSHVGIYMGNNEFIHTSSKLKKVTIDSLETPYYLKRFIGAKRLIREAYGEEKGEHQDES